RHDQIAPPPRPGKTAPDEKYSEPFAREVGYMNMRLRLNSCRDRREDVSLLASGALQEADAARVREHLAHCAGCRQHFEEISKLSSTLQGWAESESPIKPSTAFHARWMHSIQTA